LILIQNGFNITTNLSDNINLTEDQINKFKKKWYKNNIDPQFEIENFEKKESTPSSPPPRSTPSSPPPRSTPSSSSPPPQSHSNTRNTNFASSQARDPRLVVQYYSNVSIVPIYLMFAILFIIRASYLSTYCWYYIIFFAIMSYGTTLYHEVKDYVPRSFSTMAYVQFFTVLSANQNCQFIFYCIIIYHSQHISAVGLLPLAIYALINTSDFYISLVNTLASKFPIGITRLMSLLLTQLLQRDRHYLEYAAAFAEILTFPILLWRWISGVSHEISLFDIIMMGQFLNQRKNVSMPMQRILNELYNLYREKLRALFPR